MATAMPSPHSALLSRYIPVGSSPFSASHFGNDVSSYSYSNYGKRSASSLSQLSSRSSDLSADSASLHSTDTSPSSTSCTCAEELDFSPACPAHRSSASSRQSHRRQLYSQKYAANMRYSIQQQPQAAPQPVARHRRNHSLPTLSHAHPSIFENRLPLQESSVPEEEQEPPPSPPADHRPPTAASTRTSPSPTPSILSRSKNLPCADLLHMDDPLLVPRVPAHRPSSDKAARVLGCQQRLGTLSRSASASTISSASSSSSSSLSATQQTRPCRRCSAPLCAPCAAQHAPLPPSSRRTPATPPYSAPVCAPCWRDRSGARALVRADLRMISRAEAAAEGFFCGCPEVVPLCSGCALEVEGAKGGRWGCWCCEGKVGVEVSGEQGRGGRACMFCRLPVRLED